MADKHAHASTARSNTISAVQRSSLPVALRLRPTRSYRQLLSSFLRNDIEVIGIKHGYSQSGRFRWQQSPAGRGFAIIVNVDH